MDGGRSRKGGGMLALLALHAFTEYSRLESKPPVTAALVAANTLVYLRKPAALDALLPTIDQVWFNPYLILKVCFPFPLLSCSFFSFSALLSQFLLGLSPPAVSLQLFNMFSQNEISSVQEHVKFLINLLICFIYPRDREWHLIN